MVMLAAEGCTRPVLRLLWGVNSDLMLACRSMPECNVMQWPGLGNPAKLQALLLLEPGWTQAESPPQSSGTEPANCNCQDCKDVRPDRGQGKSPNALFMAPPPTSGDAHHKGGLNKTR